MAGLSLFWRTFFLLALLLLACVLAWTQTWRKMEFEPRAIQTARADRLGGQLESRRPDAQ
jgi:hypothetical protein